MSTTKQKEILRIIFGNIFWVVVAIGLLFSGSVHGVWRVVVIVWLTMQVVTLYGNVSKYIKEDGRKKQEDYNKTMNDFRKTENDWARRTQERQQQYQQQTIRKPEISITDAYKLMKLKYSDTPEDIKKRYRQLAMQWHPDKFANDTLQKQETAKRNFQKLNSAYNIIKKHKNIA